MVLSMKIVIFGLTVSSSWGNGHATLWRGLINALARLGHDVTFFERNTDFYAENRDLEALNEARLVLYDSLADALAEAQARTQGGGCGDHHLLLPGCDRGGTADA